MHILYMLGFIEEWLYYLFAVATYDGFAHTFGGGITDTGGHCKLSTPENMWCG